MILKQARKTVCTICCGYWLSVITLQTTFPDPLNITHMTKTSKFVETNIKIVLQLFLYFSIIYLGTFIIFFTTGSCQYLVRQLLAGQSGECADAIDLTLVS
ncbi:hypothetical protein PVAP13_3NG185300 [Panicum virgatum]|uniref:Uncharacterized protein n=1 Tax=Panicum virgatum TaxID=38727 RepID=A0A8T0UK77_PANVG|nr:hypothetical protein PVAP13_3NG185300 [Panicum virgatum]